MGALFRKWDTIPMPEGAMIGRDGTVTWVANGKKRTGKISKSGKVNVQLETWTAQYTDEGGVVRRVSIKTKNRIAAEKILARYETEIERIRTGIATREELDYAQARKVTLDDALEQFRTKMVASDNTPQHINLTLQRISQFCHETGIDSLAKFRRETTERWIASEIQRKERSPGTINHYITAIKSFVKYVVDIKLLPSNPLVSVKKLNQEVEQRKKRRALTEDEIERLLKAAAMRKYRKKVADEQVLIYRLLLGTGLRSTELSLLTPSQINFERNRLTIEAEKTKNKKADVMPMRPDLVQAVKEWVELHGIQPHERIFLFDKHSIRRSFYRDLKAAGIERVGADGRSIDVHSLRKTFGTELARAGVPLTTVQRLMRHSTPLLTAKLYIDVEAEDMTQALDKMRVY